MDPSHIPSDASVNPNDATAVSLRTDAPREDESLLRSTASVDSASSTKAGLSRVMPSRHLFTGTTPVASALDDGDLGDRPKALYEILVRGSRAQTDAGDGGVSRLDALSQSDVPLSNSHVHIGFISALSAAERDTAGEAVDSPAASAAGAHPAE